MRKPNYVWVEGCELCENGYNSAPCPVCGGMGGRCANPDCWNGEVPDACICNNRAYEIEEEVA